MSKRIRMSKRARRDAGAPRNAESRTSSGASYKTGYGSPPREHQFKPGQSGNPKGRPKGVKNNATLLHDILDRMIEVRTGSGIRKMSVREAMLTRIAESGLKGDIKSAAFVLQRYDVSEIAQEQANGSTMPEEQEIIDAYREMYLNRRGPNK